jgi:sulfide:quinone oxidoreductase
MPQDPAEVVVVGGGVAGLEGALALRALAGDRVRLTILDPAREFVYRPMTVAEPFGAAEPRRPPLADLAAGAGAHLQHVRVDAVLAGERRLVLRSGETLPYETLLLAPGARTLSAFDGAVTFGLKGSGAATRALVEAARAGAVRTMAFLAASRVGWSLPLYELALMTAAACRDHEVRLVVATPEPTPLEHFGPEVSGEVAGLLEQAGIEFAGGTVPDLRDGRLALGSSTVEVDGAISLPLMRGPVIEGVPAEPEFGFIPVDDHGRVEGLDGVYAAGDAVDFPIKQGGLATQQADAAAEHIAARHGAGVRPAPLRPVLRGLLLTGDGERFLRARGDGSGGEAPSAQPLWWPPTKIAGRYLAPFLAARDPSAVAGEAPEGFVEVEVDVGAPAAGP